MKDQEQEEEIQEEKDQEELPKMVWTSIPEKERAANIEFVNKDLPDPRVNKMPTNIEDQPQSTSLEPSHSFLFLWGSQSPSIISPHLSRQATSFFEIFPPPINITHLLLQFFSCNLALQTIFFIGTFSFSFNLILKKK